MLVGSDLPDAIENFYVRYLKESGMDVYFFPAHTLFHNYYYAGLYHKLLFRSGLSGIYPAINRRLRAAVEEFKPEVIWIFKGMEIFPETLSFAREKGILLVNYNPDNPFIFSGRGSGNQNITRSIGLYDLLFTYNLEILQQLESKDKKIGAVTALLPFGYDVDDESYQQAAGQEEVIRVCFLGNPDDQRASFIEGLAAQDIPMDVYGRDWDKWLRNPHIRIFPPVYGVEMWKVLRRYRVQLNLMRIHNLDSHNMRTFEVPGIGGIMLAPDTREHRVFFEAGKEVFLYKDLEDCAAQARQLMQLPATEAEQIRRQARQRSQGYSYKDRTKQALEKIRSL